MENEFIKNMKHVLHTKDFDKAENELKGIKPQHQEIALLLAKAGFSSKKILENFENIFEFTCNSEFTTKETVKMVKVLESSYHAGATMREILVGEQNKINQKPKARTFTEEKVLLAISQMHPYPLREILNIFDRCKSIDETIFIIEKSRQLSTPLMILASLRGY